MSYHLIRKGDIASALKTPSRVGKNMLSPFDGLLSDKAPLRILEDHQVMNIPEVHTTEGDLWHCIEGEADFTLGGVLVDQKEVSGFPGAELNGSGIEGGEQVTVTAGDWLWIPPNVAHQHGSKGTGRFIIIKIGAPLA